VHRWVPEQSLVFVIKAGLSSSNANMEAQKSVRSCRIANIGCNSSTLESGNTNIDKQT
jgi:hypothetical protein